MRERENKLAQPIIIYYNWQNHVYTSIGRANKHGIVRGLLIKIVNAKLRC